MSPHPRNPGVAAVLSECRRVSDFLKQQEQLERSVVGEQEWAAEGSLQAPKYAWPAWPAEQRALVKGASARKTAALRPLGSAASPMSPTTA